ncbi:hypothetical protein J3459_005993 [Metarhizium acridum]|uniref:Thioredoxin reductase n=2 Tax=Metarhizium acridum TaxID=92637 RepID=E9EAY5_METAQ|nr:thioredoxin reductase [Metarhizium acridum CQMa 102]EFY86916.1 thioredoxin reductase [Metarhizium acridum CQMa 102]KAG8428207.1 hypothetical protein J3459_005993 [Metarhizium acridum]
MTDISESLVASLAETLDAAGASCILWGQFLLNVHGIPSTIGSIDFIVPGSRLAEAIQALENARNLAHCPDKDACPWSPQRRKAMEPVFHMHLGNSARTVTLYTHCQILWFLPQMNSPLPSSGQQQLELPQHLTLASSSADLPPHRPGRGSGFFTTVEYPVVVLRLHVLLDTYIRLYLRDRKRRDGAYARHSIKLLTPCIDDEELPGSREISDRIKRYYKTLANGDEIILGRSGM